MIFGIKHTSNTRKGRQVVNNSLQKYGSAIMFRDGKLDYYFDNVFSAIKAAHRLQKAHNGLLSYDVFKVAKDKEKSIPVDKIFSSYEEYKEASDRKTQELIEQLEKLNNPSSVLAHNAETETTM